MSDKNRGLYQKFQVRRTDGSSENGGKHDGCEYFVLDLTHDQFAAPALDAYEQACRSEHPQLAEDLRLMRAVHKAGFTEHRELPFTSHGKTWDDLESQNAALQQQAEHERVLDVLRDIAGACNCSPTQMETAINYIAAKVAALQQEVARLREELESAGAKTYSEMERLSQGWKAAESSLLAMREALEMCSKLISGDMPSYEDDTHILERVGKLINSALSTTSAQAEEIKARWQAEALREAAEEIRMTTYDRVQIVAYMDARAAQLTAPAVAREKP